METVNNGSKTRKQRYFTASKITKIGIFSALSFVLYAFLKFPLPIFPSFLEFNFSDVPALIGGFVMGPLAGVIIIVVKVLLKLPLSTSGGVGELADLIIGLAFVLPPAIMYKKRKTLKLALTGILIGSLLSVAAAILSNIYILVPLYVNVFFGGNISILLSLCQPFAPSITEQNFNELYSFYIILPFNLLRCTIAGLLTFLLYKRTSKILHKFKD